MIRKRLRFLLIKRTMIGGRCKIRRPGRMISLAAAPPGFCRDFESGTKRRFNYRFFFYAQERNDRHRRPLRRFWWAQMIWWASSFLFFGVIQVYGQGAPSGGAPVVMTESFNSSTPASSGAAVGTVSATNSPKSWSITAGNSGGDFTIS